MQIEPLGDSALIVRVVDSFSAETSLKAVVTAVGQLETAALPGVIELAPAYTTVGVFFDPALTVFEALRTQIEQVLHHIEPARRAGTGRTVEVPVCYED